MHHSRWTRRLALPGLFASLLIVIAAWSATSVDAVSYGSPAPSASPTAMPVASSLQLGVAASATLGAYLTGPGGHALYTLSSDSTAAPVCNGPCLVNWPPLLLAPGGTVTGAAGATGTFGTFVRADGTTQVTYDGHPVYYFAHDTAAGQTNGEGIAALGGVWHVALGVLAATAASTPSASPSPSQTLPPTDAAGGQPNGGPGGVLPLLLLILGLGAASIVAVTGLSTAARRR